MKLFRVIKPGFLSSFQDSGRYGYQQFGLSPSGAMDEINYRWGNALLGNPANACSLEITLGNCELEAVADAQILVSGADLNFQINAQNAPRYQPLIIHKGDYLSWSHPIHGVRTYLCVRGGFDQPSPFGSCSINLRDHIGQPLTEGDWLNSHDVKPLETAYYFPQSELRDFQQPLTLRLLATDQFEQFSVSHREAFFEQDFTISTDFDRTGCRLEASQPLETPFENMISEGITAGTVQIPQHGHPIIMMKDHPTIGGYPKIGTVFSLDLAYLAQCFPHQIVQFKPISMQRAQALRQQFEDRLSISLRKL